MIKVKKVWLFFIILALAISSRALAGPVPDTGQTQSYTDTFGEDSDYTINPHFYTKLDASGSALPDSATEWVMVRDNVTGLIWEVKTDDNSIHDKDNLYTWYDAENVFIAELNNEVSPGERVLFDTKELDDMFFIYKNFWHDPEVREKSLTPMSFIEPEVI